MKSSKDTVEKFSRFKLLTQTIVKDGPKLNMASSSRASAIRHNGKPIILGTRGANELTNSIEEIQGEASQTDNTMRFSKETRVIMQNLGLG